jgi:DNA topoisomerase-1
MGLLYYPDTQPGIIRRKHGRGFTYLSPDGTRIGTCEERARIKRLAVPPAYADVWISPHHNGHLQATGRDVRNRKQYLYHPEWTNQRALKKFDQLAGFAKQLPKLRRWIANRLTGEIGDLDTAVAAALALIDRGSLRPGNPEYTQQNGSYGVLTLRDRHVIFDGTRILLNYTAKGGNKVEKSVYGKQLQRVLQQSADLPGQELISWQDDNGDARAVRSEHIQDVLANVVGEGATAKTLRTWNGSHAAFIVAMNKEQLTVKAMADAASQRLHNTPTVARSSYIHPDIIALASLDDDDRTSKIAAIRPTVNNDQYRSGETELIRFLE